jgi:hypothetical protein
MMNNWERLVPVLNGFDMMDGGDTPIGVSVSCRVGSATSIIYTISSPYADSNTLWYIGVDVIICHVRQLNIAMPTSFHIPSNNFDRDNGGGYNFSPTLQSNIMFYGLSKLAKRSPINRPFDYSLYNNDSRIGINLASNNQEITI